jgi:hypothetical protein
LCQPSYLVFYAFALSKFHDIIFAKSVVRALLDKNIQTCARLPHSHLWTIFRLVFSEELLGAEMLSYHYSFVSVVS